MSKTDGQLRSEIASNESLAEWGAWGVVVGLVLEVGLAMALSLGYRNAIIENWGAVLADSLIALGVVCEISFERRASRASAELQRRSEERVAKANARAAEAELQTEKLRSELAWRRLSSVSVNAISEALSGFPKMSIRIVYCSDDPEAGAFAHDIAKVYKDNGWRVGFIFASMFAGETIFGLRIPLYGPPDINACAAARVAFSKAQIGFTGGSIPFFHSFSGGGDDTVSPCADIYVGPKPALNLAEDVKTNPQSANTPRETSI